ncbi:hypothetical protein [Mycoplasmopsis synoviae]|uniref:hypothetical protein n=1 Tax=Mycoplasmopsis synoviae TaxID=2109 RepID=UPI001CE1FB66|nr:hypothetical protein [Mycoplasmopsis synoviae]
MQFISGSVTAAKTLQAEEQYTNVSQDLRTDLDAKLTAATSLLEDETKLKNLNADGTLATTQSDLESAKSAIDAAVDAVKPELEFQKTKTSAAAKVTELESLVNPALKAELQRQVNELTKEQADQATTMLANLTSLKESLESLQTLVSNGLKMQVDYPQKYYDADNKEAFDAALLKASSVFPAFKWTAQSIIVETPEGQLPNPRAWTKAREKSEFVLQNFVMAPAQAAPATQSDSTAAESASATVRLATEETSTNSGESSPSPTPEASTPMADLASTVSYLKSLNDTLKATTDALNGDNPTTKTAYYKTDTTRTLYWDGFMPKIVLTDFDKTWEQNSENERKIREWFREASSWAGLSDQLTKKLGAERFKNVKLTYKEVTFSTNAVKTPTVTFTVAAQDGYTLDNSANEISLVVRVLYNRDDESTIQLPTQGASSSAAPSGSSVNDANVKANVNVYLNYTGPSIVLDTDLPTVGNQNNTSLNGTSNVEGTFNTAFRGNPTSGLLFTNRYPNPLLKSVINYVNKFDPKYRATFVTNSRDGVTITKVQNTKELRPGTLDDLNGNNVFLQQMKNDTEAVYLPVTAIASNGWLNTFLIRIPLTKFVKPLTEFQAQSSPTTGTSLSSN